MENAEEGLTFCSARPEFVGLSECDVWDAIEGDHYGDNPITCEVTRLGAEFLTKFKAFADERGCVPIGVLQVDARCPIERVAILTLLRYVEARSGGAHSGAVH